MSPATWTMIHYGKPWSINAERRQHWSHRHQQAREFREAFCWLARKEQVPPLGEIMVVAVPIFRMHKPQDVGNCYPAVKAAIDGLVDAGVIPDDTPEHVASITFVRPIVGERRDALSITVEAL